MRKTPYKLPPGKVRQHYIALGKSGGSATSVKKKASCRSNIVEYWRKRKAKAAHLVANTRLATISK